VCVSQLLRKPRRPSGTRRRRPPGAESGGARARAQVSVELGNGYADVVAAADVALYGGLCALASLERPEFRSSVVENVAFREFLDAHPEARARSPAARTLRRPCAGGPLAVLSCAQLHG